MEGKNCQPKERPKDKKRCRNSWSLPVTFFLQFSVGIIKIPSSDWTQPTNLNYYCGVQTRRVRGHIETATCNPETHQCQQYPILEREGPDKPFLPEAPPAFVLQELIPLEHW